MGTCARPQLFEQTITVVGEKRYPPIFIVCFPLNGHTTAVYHYIVHRRRYLTVPARAMEPLWSDAVPLRGLHESEEKTDMSGEGEEHDEP